MSDTLRSNHHAHHLILERFNDAAKRGVYSLQEFFVLAGKALGFIFVKPFYTADLFQQMDVIGVGSLGIVLLTGFFTGMVLALQMSVQLQAFGQQALIGKVIAGSMVRELGPVLAGLMVAGRVGSGIAADSSFCQLLRGASTVLRPNLPACHSEARRISDFFRRRRRRGVEAQLRRIPSARTR